MIWIRKFDRCSRHATGGRSVDDGARKRCIGGVGAIHVSPGESVLAIYEVIPVSNDLMFFVVRWVRKGAERRGPCSRKRGGARNVIASIGLELQKVDGHGIDVRPVAGHLQAPAKRSPNSCRRVR